MHCAIFVSYRQIAGLKYRDENILGFEKTQKAYPIV